MEIIGSYKKLLKQILSTIEYLNKKINILYTENVKKISDLVNPDTKY